MFRTLDPVSENPQFTGPTRDMKAITSKEAVYRQEPFQITPQRMPVRMATKERPVTHATPVVGLRPERIPVLVRASNGRPIEAGEGLSSGTWAVSDPGWYHRPGEKVHGALGEDPAAATSETAGSGIGYGKLAVLGAAVGLAIYFLARK
jgi:hypothetical protein